MPQVAAGAKAILFGGLSHCWVDARLILQHDADDELLRGFIRAAVSYAESWQKKKPGRYRRYCFAPSTEQAVIVLASHFYESRNGSTGGYFADSVPAGQQVWNTVHTLLRMDKDWEV